MLHRRALLPEIERGFGEAQNFTLLGPKPANPQRLVSRDDRSGVPKLQYEKGSWSEVTPNPGKCFLDCGGGEHKTDRIEKAKCGVEARLSKTELAHVLLFEPHLRRGFAGLCAGTCQHVIGHIRGHDLIAELLQFEGVTAGAARDIQQPLCWT